MPGAVQTDTGNDLPWPARYDVDFPGELAVLGAGYAVQLTSDACAPLAYTEYPEDFVGVGNGQAQASAERGNLEVCSGCIMQSCDALIP